MASALPVYWRLVLCDLYGVPLSLITGIASNIELQYTLNRPAMLSFDVPSEDSAVNNLYSTSGLPWLHAGDRIIKAFRKSDASEPGGWELEFVGRVWTTEDQGDGDACRTMVTCYDPLYDLIKRIVRRKDGTFLKDATFYGVPGSTAIKRMIDRTNTYGVRPTFIATAGDDVGWDATAVITKDFQQAMILPSMIEIMDSATVDIYTRYVNFKSVDHSTWPTYAHVGAAARVGQDRPHTVIGYAGPPRNATGFNRTMTMETFANDITGWGKSAKGHEAHETDTTSIEQYGAFEDAMVLTDVEYAEFVDDLINEELVLRKLPRDIVSFQPQPESAQSPFSEFALGDTIMVNAALAPNPVTRQQVEGLQRIYGFTLQIDDDYGEHVSSLSVSRDDTTA